MFSPLLTWYQENGRDLPWRATKDPYKIWLSEIILQQTRVEQGLAYYLRFTEAFPAVDLLASASEDEVLRLWQGLGYYSRARNLHYAAQQIVSMGGFPATYSEIRSLKGIGDYTAAAIASFAYGLPHAVVDGNVYRVLSRFFAINTPIDSTAGKRQFATLAQEILPPRHAALHNQAMMDLGAMVCTPRAPQCSVCPLVGACLAHAEGRAEAFPVKEKRVQVRHRYFTYLIVTDGHSMLLRRRPKGDIWQGLYEPLLIETEAPLSEGELMAHAVVAPLLTSQTMLSPIVSNLVHKLSHQHLHASAYALRSEAPFSFPLPDATIVVPLSALNDYALPRLVTLILERVGDKG
jgi:A/G-specific adenine glycosylase